MVAAQLDILYWLPLYLTVPASFQSHINFLPFENSYSKRFLEKKTVFQMQEEHFFQARGSGGSVSHKLSNGM